ncbi:N-acetylmuramoyl-L-alanine amidase [Streptomyces flavidovirens]|uniref:peptidoglycan recognition protein family protein n=1 Tax=Streptomyces flavidovirens TaxID=67298 RepID=UPI00368319C2
MAWYPGATKYELQPESDSQPAIRPTQFIVHSIIAPWTAKRTYEYWRDSTNLESHFGLGYEGDLGQFIGTETRADANASANRRPDGTGAVSIETASNLQGSDPWTPAQVEKLIALGVWLHKRHDIPLRICRTHDDPGFGYHRLHSAWAVSGTACPGDARVKQFREVVFPGIAARANGQTVPPEEEDEMTPDEIFKAVWFTDKIAAPNTASDKTTNVNWQAQSYLKDIGNRVRAMDARTAAQGEAIKQLAAALASHHAVIDPEALVARITEAIENVTVRLDITP